MSKDDIPNRTTDGIVSYNQAKYNDGAEHVYGVNEHGKHIHVTHNRVIEAHGHSANDEVAKQREKDWKVEKVTRESTETTEQLGEIALDVDDTTTELSPEDLKDKEIDKLTERLSEVEAKLKAIEDEHVSAEKEKTKERLERLLPKYLETVKDGGLRGVTFDEWAPSYDERLRESAKWRTATKPFTEYGSGSADAYKERRRNNLEGSPNPTLDDVRYYQWLKEQAEDTELELIDTPTPTPKIDPLPVPKPPEPKTPELEPIPPLPPLPTPPIISPVETPPGDDGDSAPGRFKKMWNRIRDGYIIGTYKYVTGENISSYEQGERRRSRLLKRALGAAAVAGTAVGLYYLWNKGNDGEGVTELAGMVGEDQHLGTYNLENGTHTVNVILPDGLNLKTLDNGVSQIVNQSGDVIIDGNHLGNEMFSADGSLGTEATEILNRTYEVSTMPTEIMGENGVVQHVVSVVSEK